jgi:hypothetical protein
VENRGKAGAFLPRKIELYKWSGILLVEFGLSLALCLGIYESAVRGLYLAAVPLALFAAGLCVMAAGTLVELWP